MDDANWVHRNEVSNKDKEKAKSHLLFSANQPQTKASKKNKRHRSWQGHSAIDVYATKITKKNKDNAKDLSHIKNYTCKQKVIMQQVSQKTKKLVAILANPTLVTEKKKELERIPCIWYSITFKNQTKALLNLRSEVNAMSQVFAHQLGLTIWKTNVEAQKIDGTTLETYEMVVSTFSMFDKDGRERFFEKSFLLTDVKPEIVLGCLSWLWLMLTLILKLGTYNEGPIPPETYFWPSDKSSW